MVIGYHPVEILNFLHSLGWLHPTAKLETSRQKAVEGKHREKNGRQKRTVIERPLLKKKIAVIEEA
ncbi:MAG: hypothetical protein A2W09_01260 [Deltaproteobacteria bacterium RBG_16_50_11]|nr:MAG: hypothetical protein A2W09_01260 [Deltaproteobacteria bacterium RBG_16_50_11]